MCDFCHNVQPYLLDLVAVVDFPGCFVTAKVPVTKNQGQAAATQYIWFYAVYTAEVTWASNDTTRVTVIPNHRDRYQPT